MDFAAGVCSAPFEGVSRRDFSDGFFDFDEPLPVASSWCVEVFFRSSDRASYAARVSTYRAPVWTPFFTPDLPLDYVPPPDAFATPDAPLVRLVNLLLLDARKRGYSVRLTPDAPSERAIFFADGGVLGRETPSAPLVAALITRLREMSGLDVPPPAIGRIFLRLGETASAVFVVHACLTATSERLVISHLRGATFSDPTPEGVPAVRRIARLLDEGRQGEDVAKLVRARDEATRLGGAEGARLDVEASMALGHLEEDRDVARTHYERALRLATDVDGWNVAAALDCLGGLRTDAGEPPRDAFAPLFTHLDRTFGAHEPITVGWKSDVIERMMDDDREAGRAAWRALRPAFVAAFGDDDVAVARLDAR